MLHATLRRGQDRRFDRWLPALLCVLVLGAAVPCHAQVPPPGPAEQQAAELAAAGRHREAADRYEQAARRGFLSWDVRLALLAAREYLAAGEDQEAARLADKARGRVRDDEQVALLALVDGRLALARGDAVAATAALRTAPMSVANELAADVLDVRSRAEIAAGDTLAGVRTHETRGALLPDDAARAASDRALLEQLLQHPPTSVEAPPGASERERGWLELPSLLAAAAGGAPNDPASARGVRDWLGRHPGHPGTAFIPQAAVSAATTYAAGPGAGMALLVPLSGRQRAAAEAVRDGFTAAWFAGAASDARPRVAIYDTSAAGAGAAYARAVADGARVVVGPLLKDEVASVLAANPAGLPVPTLALNSAGDAAAGTPPTFLYQFALDPEHEARAAARRIAADGLVRGIALFPESAWGRRVHDAFVDELQRTGSVMLMTPPQFYAADAKDFSGPLRAALGRYGGAGDRGPAGRPTPSRDGTAERATGPQFAFVAASPQAARALRPQLRFQMTYGMPVYATSDAWEPGGRAVSDLEGLVFPELPWLLYAGQGAPDLWSAVREGWQVRGRGRWRLYAFGFDAFRLAQQLGSGVGAAGLQGLTGTLEIMPGQGHVHRTLEFARIEGGRPVPAVSGSIMAEPAPNAAGPSPVD